MTAQHGRRTFPGNAARDGPQDSCAFCGGGNGTDERFRVHQCGHTQRNRLFRHRAEFGKTAVVHLLLAADIVQVDHFDKARIAEIDRRVIEGDMPVFADPHADQVDRSGRKDLGIAFDDIFRSERQTDIVQLEEFLERNLADQVVVQVT